MADIKKIIKDLQDGFGTTEEDKGAVLALFKGLIFSDDKLAKEYMKKLDKATTEISKEMSEDKDDKKKKESYNRVREGTKTYNVQNNVGKSKYVVNFHDGEKSHKDGSNFYDIEIFKNKTDLNDFIDELENAGYIKEKSILSKKSIKEAKNIGAISYYKTDGAIQVTFPSEQEYITIRNARLTYDDFMDFVESLSNSEVYDSGEDKGMEYTYVQRSGIIKLEKFFDSNIDEFEEM